MRIGESGERQVWPGEPYPLGATLRPGGVNFALFSANATRVWLCLFSEDGQRETHRIRLPNVTAHVWHGFVPGLTAGQLYGYRVEGPFDPMAGHRFNANKLLIDPYARALQGQVDWSAPVFAYQFDSGGDDLTYDERDDAYGVPKGIVIDPTFDWGGDAPPDIPYHESVIYEVHVRGFTKLHPQVPPELRGTYAGLASEPAVRFLQELGITAVELMPVHAFTEDRFLVDRGQTNYWGYNSINFFAPEAKYSSVGDRGGQVNEIKNLVKTLHAVGIEVILDVVYNHTGEGNGLGPTLSFKGIDNASYYRLMPEAPRYYMDYTGTGNSLNARSPETLKLIMDSLRYWITDVHVDGFRFDLAATLARELHEVDKLSAFFDIIHQDPLISRVKLIAEPWDVGDGGYQIGNFPVLWTEWNSRYRDSVRRYWRGDPGKVAELAARLTGSSDLYGSDGRNPYHSINFITAHDGFTLRDLVTYNEKHNEANLDGNHDGYNENYSCNYGVEGESDDEAIIAVRDRQVRNLLTTLLVSQGVPMLVAGDEFGRTQLGNNNAYCQDNEISWLNWEMDERGRALLAFTKRLLRFRKAQPVLKPSNFLLGRRIRGSDFKDIMWLRPDGNEMVDEEWNEGFVRALGVRLSGDGLNEFDDVGQPIYGDTLLLLLNAHTDVVKFTLPQSSSCEGWIREIDTSIGDGSEAGTVLPSGGDYLVGGRSMVVMRQSVHLEPRA